MAVAFVTALLTAGATAVATYYISTKPAKSIAKQADETAKTIGKNADATAKQVADKELAKTTLQLSAGAAKGDVETDLTLMRGDPAARTASIKLALAMADADLERGDAAYETPPMNFSLALSYYNDAKAILLPLLRREFLSGRCPPCGSALGERVIPQGPSAVP